MKKLPNSKNIFGTDSVKAYYKKIVPQDKNFSVVHVTKEYTEKLLSSINISKAVGIDNISGRFLIDGASKLQPLTKILRQIAALQQKLTFQAIWKVLIFSLEMTRLLKIEKWLEASALGCHPARNGHVTH